MKKFILTLLSAALIALAILPASAAFAAGYEKGDPDQMLVNTIKSFGVEGVDTKSFKRDKLYDLNLNENGLEYSFTVDGRQGFALLRSIVDKESKVIDYAVEEVYLDAVSPYADTLGKKVYAGQMAYIDYQGGTYKDSRTDMIIPAEVVNQIKGLENTYLGDGYIGGIVETINYKFKYDTQFAFQFGVPSYTYVPGDASCANLAGALIMTYNDIYKTNLIPNFSPLENYNGTYRYWPNQPQEVTNLITQFFSLMNTHPTNGTTLNNFKNGMTSYINSRGYGVSYISVMSGSSLNMNAYKAEIMNERAVALCLQKFNVITYILQNGGYDKISTNFYNGGHIMVGYGVREINYFRDEEVSVWSPVWYNPFRYITEIQEVNFRNDAYLRVNTGLEGLGFMRVDGTMKLDAAFSVVVS